MSGVPFKINPKITDLSDLADVSNSDNSDTSAV